MGFYAFYPPGGAAASTITVTQGTTPWIVAGQGTAGSPASGVVTVQGIAGGTAVPVSIAGTVPVSGSVSVTNFPATQTITGTVAVSNFPATQPVSGTVTANIGTTGGLQLDTTGAKLNVAQAAALGTNTGPLVQGSVTTAAPTYTTATVNPLSLTTGGGLRVDVSGSAAPTGAATSALQTSGNASLTTIATNTTGASTAALQTTGNTSLATIATNTTGAATGTNVTETHGTVAAGTAAAKSELTGGVYNTSLPTLTNGQQVASQFDSSGRQIIAPLTSASSLSIAGKAKNVLATLDYSTTNVGNAAYVQVVASTSLATTKLYPFDSSGAVMILAVGGVGSEVDQLYIPPGGSGAGYELAIPASSRISLKVASFASNPNSVTSGFFVLTGLN